MRTQGYRWGNNLPWQGQVDPKADRSALDAWHAEQRAAAKEAREARKAADRMAEEERRWFEENYR